MNVQVFSEYEALANHRLDRAGFGVKSIEELGLPSVENVYAPDGTPLLFQVYGDRVEARTHVYVPLSYSVKLEDLSQQVRLKAKQTSLGEDFCVIGVQLYEPGLQGLNRAQRGKVKRGNYEPLADRLLTVIDAVDPRDDQAVMLYGFSEAGDVVVETAFQNTMGAFKGARALERIGAIDCARSTPRNRLLGGYFISKAFERSGENLFDNIVASNSPALLEAHGIDLSHPNAAKEHKAQTKSGVMKYVKADLAGNLAKIRGMATDASLEQLLQLIGQPDAPRQVVGRLEDSLICPPEFIDALRSAFWSNRKLFAYEAPGDHSTVDNIRTSAAFVLHAASV